MSLSLSIGIIWSFKRTPNLLRKTLLDMSLGLMLGGFILARATHVFYEAPSYYLDNPLEVLMIWKGGFVFYGGAIGGFLGAFFVLKAKGENWAQWADWLAPVGAFSYGVGRMGCFFAGCCYGQVTTLPWSITFPHVLAARHPTQLYATFMEWCICGILLSLEKKKSFLSTPGRVFFTWITLHSIARFFMESLRDDFRGPDLLGLSVSQIISGFLWIVGLWGVVWYRGSIKKAPIKQ